MTEAPPTSVPGVTPSQTVGPFFHDGLIALGGDHVVPAGHPGAVWLRGQVLDGEGEPVPDAMVEVWQLDPEGNGPDDSTLPGFTGTGRVPTDEHGRYRVRVLTPPETTTVDGLPQAPHIDVVVHARGLLRHLVTRAYVLPTDPDAAQRLADADPVLGALDTDLRGRLVAVRSGDDLDLDIHLQGELETPFFDV
jgi:protocatechuate 3,4-dioxygenase alpha subunit